MTSFRHHSFASRLSSHHECCSSAHHVSNSDRSGMADVPGLKLAGPAPGAASGDWCLKQPLTLMISLGFFPLKTSPIVFDSDQFLSF